MPEIKKITLGSGKTRYRFVVDVGRKADGKRNQLTVTKDTLTEAKAELSRIENEQNSGSFVAPNKLTVNEWLDQWMAKKAEDLEETTMYSYEITLKRVRGKLGHIRLQELTEEDVEEWMHWAIAHGNGRWEKSGKPLSVVSVDMSLARLKEALGRAVTRRLVTLNVAENLSIPRRARKAERKTKAELIPWGVPEVHKFITGIREDRLYAPFLLSLMGLRPAEVCGLRWADVDLVNGTLLVANTRTMKGNKTVIEKDTKSMAGERALPLPAFVWDALKAFKAVQAKEKLALGEAYANSGYVLVDESGVARNIKQLRRRAYRLMVLLGLRQVRLYDARSSCFTYLANRGVKDHILARWAGHTNVKTTQRWYIKPDVEDLRGAATVWEGLHGVQPQAREKM